MLINQFHYGEIHEDSQLNAKMQIYQTVPMPYHVQSGLLFKRLTQVPCGTGEIAKYNADYNAVCIAGYNAEYNAEYNVISGLKLHYKE